MGRPRGQGEPKREKSRRARENPAVSLCAQDPKLAPIVQAVGPYRFRPQSGGTHFAHVVRAIIFQQLSSKAASCILERFLGLFGGRQPTPRELLGTPEMALRAAGLSRQKLSYLRDLSEKAESGAVLIESLHELDDDALVDTLTQVNGVGTWTAQMFLIFRLGRKDVLPATDLGIRKAVMLARRMRDLPTPKEVERVGENWRPYRSVASWYLWRSLDNGFWA
ncbi:MAG: DNA-3-methyladenine glycosylase 2 family protein [Deltaproteobacteria bacterium]|nr:DNA-3-methyladenine glycosylase 2 family protein [Deltaproteobacteria bacterium]